MMQAQRKYPPFSMKCPCCGKTFIPDRRQLRSMAVGRQKVCYCSKECFVMHCPEKMKGANNPHWKNGIVKSRSYTCIRTPGYYKTNKYVAEHILVAEKIIGRRLRPSEVVHHINKNRSDNRPENLKVMTVSEHVKYHRAIEKEGATHGTSN